MAGQGQKSTGGKNRKYGRNKVKCENYRRYIGKPKGPGVLGNKAGRKHK
jgi:hypothetical protein